MKTQNIELVKFETVYNDTDEKYIFQTVETYNNGDFYYKLLIEIIKLPDTGNKYVIIVSAVMSPKEFSKETLESIANTFGIESNEVSFSEIYEYGISAKFDDKAANTLDEAFEVAKEFEDNTVMFNSLFGFYMDKPQNRLGKTGWDFIRGNIG